MRRSLTLFIATALMMAPALSAQNVDPRLESLKDEALERVQDRA